MLQLVRREGVYGVHHAPGQGWSLCLGLSLWELKGCKFKLNKRRHFSTLHSPVLGIALLPAPSLPQGDTGEILVTALAWGKGQLQKWGASRLLGAL